MEREVASRRINALAGHFVTSEDISAAVGIIPMNCSSSLNLAPPRCDNRILFARQGSNSQASFMRQASTHQGSTAQAIAPTNLSSFNSCCNASGAPLFSRIDQNFPNLASAPKTVSRGCNLTFLEAPPTFARPNRGLHMHRQKELRTKKQLPPPKTNNNVIEEWSPRMDVAESGKTYVLTFEIPGVSAKDIKVEVNERNLTVVGVRSLQSWRLAGLDNDSVPSFHKREILQGPYQVVWPLPNGINKDRISAQFVDGFLQVVVPKI